MEGKNCFRTRWTQEPIFSGGALASLALPVPHLHPKEVDAGTQGDETPFDECLVMSCGDAVNVVRAKTGEVVCSYTLPVEDVILHIDAVSVRSTSKVRAVVMAKKERELKSEKKKSGAHGRQSREKEAEIKVEEGEDIVPADLSVPVGSYIAIGTRSLQLYVLAVDVVTEAVQAPAAVEEEGKELNAENSEEVEKAITTTTSYAVRLVQSWTAAQHAISNVYFTESGSYLVSGSTDGGVKVWNVFHHHLTHNFMCAQGGLIQTLYVDPTESYLVAGGFEGHITVFDMVLKQVVGVCRPHVQAVEAVVMDDTLQHVYSIARDRRLSILTLDAEQGRLTETRAIVVKDFVSSAVFEGAGLLHVGAMDGVVSSYAVSETEAIQLSRRLPKPPATNAEDNAEEAFVRSLLVAGKPKGAGERYFAGFAIHDTPSSAEASSSLYVGDAGFNIIRAVPHATDAKAYCADGTLVGFLDQVLDIKLFPAPRPHFHRVVVNNSKDVRLYDASGCLSRQVLQGHTDIVLCCAVSSSGEYLATAGKDCEVRVWDVAAGRTVVRGVNGHTADINSICFNAKQSETYFLLFSIAADDNLRMWDAGAALYGPSAKAGAEASIEPRSGVNAAHNGPVYTLAVAPNDQYVATGGKDKSVNLWNITGKKIYREASLKGHRRGISALSFSPADRVLASASNDGSVRLWSLVSLTCVKTLQMDRTAVLQLSFFNAGTQIVTGNAEGVVRVWAVPTSESVWTAEVHEEKVWALAVDESADGKETVFYTGAADGVLVATEDYTAEEVERVKEGRHEMILQEQALANALRKEEYGEAFKLALRLNHPRHLRQVLVKWTAKNPRECEDTLKSTLLPGLTEDETARLLQFTREWVTNSRHCLVASLITYCFVSSIHFAELAKVPAMAALVEPLLSYTRKHSQREHDLIRRTYFIDYVTRSVAPTALTVMPPFMDGDATALKKSRLE